MKTKESPSKEELEHSNRWSKSATPKYETSWYLKWISSAVILSAMSIRGIPELQLYDLGLSILGVFGWLIVAILWKDRALIILNGVGLIFLFKNLVTTLIG
jgi:hypothetical protein